jgi:hypothetical protein
MLPAERGADIAATSGGGAAKAPPGAGPRRVRAEEAIGTVQFSPPRIGALMRRGPPAPGALMAGIFGLFLLPRGHPQRFFPVVVDPTAPEEEEGSLALGKLSFPLRCWSSTVCREDDYLGRRRAWPSTG